MDRYMIRTDYIILQLRFCMHRYVYPSGIEGIRQQEIPKIKPPNQIDGKALLYYY
ncbi:hypothetical protein Niako_4968 [Niastella koreensis GR20-10]|uniref:Uncharacterized protein n=1 Tax=Niastella koreensis (strain DSM 17620 / KACC 11465 / NBRC 106392 / GR20-10) TaxID=700598 RepID=G8T8M8_NIAKG|nr:hypothetical protein Niako_4968 [Niastella koreensis GR20-10]